MSVSLEKVLTTGAGGMLGRYVDFGICTTRKDMDVENLSIVREVCMQHMPTTIFHFAAAANFVARKESPEDSFKRDALGTYNVALVAREIGAKMVYVSTSAVFDGLKKTPYLEDDMPSPLTPYGHSKYLGELLVSSMSPKNIIARTCWMFGGGRTVDHKFVANIVRQLDKPQIQVIGGTRGSPTYNKDFIMALVEILQTDATGVFHIANTGNPTRVDIAREIVRVMGAKTEVVEVDAAALEMQYPGAGSRGNESMESNRNIVLRPWQEALQEYLLEEWGVPPTQKE